MTKDISNISKLDKDNLFQTYIELINPPENMIKGYQREFYKSLIFRDVAFMPYWLVLELTKLGYYTIECK